MPLPVLMFAVIAGLLIGLVIGGLGGGGSILGVPVFVYLFGQETQIAMAGALVVVAVSSLTALLTHARAGRVRWGAGVTFGVLGILGSLLGSGLSRQVDDDLLLVGFAALLLVVAALMVRRSGRSAGGSAEPRELDIEPGVLSESRHHGLRLFGAASVVGLLTGFFGVGGGFMAVPALVLALELPMTAAIGTSLLVITINSVSALTSRLAAGIHPEWSVVVPFTAAAALASIVGALLAHRLPAKVLGRAFAGLLVVVALWTGGQALTGHL